MHYANNKQNLVAMDANGNFSSRGTATAQAGNVDPQGVFFQLATRRGKAGTETLVKTTANPAASRVGAWISW
jgi:hypothetical protein